MRSSLSAAILVLAGVLTQAVSTPAFAADGAPAADATTADAAATDPATDTATSARAQQAKAAWDAARQAMQQAPQIIKLRDQATLKIPEGYGFIPLPQAKELMNVMGNSVDDRFLGLIFPTGDDAANWFISVDFEASGYVKDDDAKNWKADELLQSLKDGTEAGNEERAAAGISPIVVTRWIEAPRYESASHRLAWAVEAKEKNGPDPDPTINYNTYLLGRDGYLELNLITSSSHVATDRTAAHKLLEAVSFEQGKRYSDFNASSDKVAEYGLAALVAGVAAKKLGLLAVIGAFLLKFAKIIFVAVAAAGGGVAKWFKGRKSGDDAPPSASA